MRESPAEPTWSAGYYRVVRKKQAMEDKVFMHDFRALNH